MAQLGDGAKHLPLQETTGRALTDLESRGKQPAFKATKTGRQWSDGKNGQAVAAAQNND